ncbi:hypothetical protein MIR68_005791 [Amoeboaphelidium protococcarum]|nr:hypothetical protein MIR68_005791 [Amoeboaphelidium protococcarum]
MDEQRSPSQQSQSQQSSNIKVVCRFRPQNQLEKSQDGQEIMEVSGDCTSVKIIGNEFSGNFTFDHVFDGSSEQRQVFELCGLPLIDQCFDGFNSTLFCYGQTSSGKSYTMMGSDIDDESRKGLTPRLAEAIFKRIEDAPPQFEFTVQTSFIEIYMEKIRDLLCPQNDNLPIHEDKSRGVYIKGLQEVYVSNVDEVYEVLRTGESYRQVSATNMNEQSSRSHSIFIITINQKDTATGTIKSGRLYLTDLAGSEKVGKTGATGQTLEEAKKINKSLSALGMVINNLTDGKSTHIPYRDSKLTRILQESLGGNSKTTLIINCSPSSFNEAETVSTLRFGTRAKTIKNKAVVNVELSNSELKVQVKKLNMSVVNMQQYIQSLETELQVWRSGGQVSEEKRASLVSSSQLNGNITPTREASSSASQSVKIPRSGSPLTLTIDERQEFMDRENELNDQLAQKEKELDDHRNLIASLSDELTTAKAQCSQFEVDNHELTAKYSDLKLQLEKQNLEHQDLVITFEALKEQNTLLQKTLEESQNVPQIDGQNADTSDKVGSESHNQDEYNQEIELLQQSLSRKEQELEQLRLSQFNASEKPVDEQLKSLMVDLQDRCQKVVDLQVQLDEAQDKNRQLQSSQNQREYQRKMQVLEKSIDQLTTVQKQLVDQNLALKTNFDIAQRKISNRDARIADLEKLFQEFNQKLASNQMAHEKQVAKLEASIQQLTQHNLDLRAKFSFGSGNVKKPLKGGLKSPLKD